MVDLYGARVGLPCPALAFKPNQALAPAEYARTAPFVAGVWRDYARQRVVITLDRADYLRCTRDAGQRHGLPAGGRRVPEALQSAMRSLADRLAGMPVARPAGCWSSAPPARYAPPA